MYDRGTPYLGQILVLRTVQIPAYYLFYFSPFFPWSISHVGYLGYEIIFKKFT